MGSFWLGVCLQAAALAATGNLVRDVRATIARGDFAAAAHEIQAYRASHGTTPEAVEAMSWMARGTFGAGIYDEAFRYAIDTRKLSLDLLRQRPLDAEPHLPAALGAAIEIQANVLKVRGELPEALRLLRQELQTYHQTSIRPRIQKNIHLLTLEGKPAPGLDVSQWIGVRPQPLERLRGHPVLLFFWAHWCGDCKGEVPILAKILETFGPRGLVLIGPTRRYGYTPTKEDATPDEEKRYIEGVREQYYAPLRSMAVPLAEENFQIYGSSTTPTLVLLDRSGIVRMYHPGAISYDQLASRVEAVLVQ